MFFRFVLNFLLIALSIYYGLLILEVNGSIRLKEDPTFKFNWKYLIPFYQFYKILK